MADGTATDKTLLNLPEIYLLELAATANESNRHVERLAAEAIDHAHAAGQALVTAKQALPHGEFETWVNLRCEFSPRTARLYMRITRNWQTITEAKERCSTLSIREAVGLLTVRKPAEPENGSALPVWLPGPGETVIGTIGKHTSIMLETVPWSPEHIRSAVLCGTELTFDLRGLHRKYVEIRVHDAPVEMSDVCWIARLPNVRENNPFRQFLPEWHYPTVPGGDE